jgi:rod shape determining protein RodA
MFKLLNHIKRLDWTITTTSISLSLLGIVSIYGSSKDNLYIFRNQLIFLFLGIILMIILSFIDWRMFKESSGLVFLTYIMGLLFLLGLFFAPAIRDVRRWYSLGSISFSPGEYIKIILIIVLAKYFSKRHVEMYRFSHIVFSGIYVFLPAAMIFFQPDLGSSLILLFLWVGILFLSGIKLNHFIILCLIGALLFSLGWAFMFKDYQKDRMKAFLEPKFDPQGINWNPEQAKIAIGSGGLFGEGIGKGPQTQYGFLPEPKTDFIFSAIAEELGLLGVFLILSLFSLLIYRILKIASKSPENFSRLFCSGFAILILVQVLVNIGMNQGIFPIVGTPLPLVSYGGSSLVFTFIGLGIIQSIKSTIDKF